MQASYIPREIFGHRCSGYGDGSPHISTMQMLENVIEGIPQIGDSADFSTEVDNEIG